MIKDWQIKRIHVLCSRIGLETRRGHPAREEEYEPILRDYGVKSSLELDYEQAQDLIARLTDIAVKMGVWERRKPRGPEYATYKQRAKILAIWDEVSYMPKNKRKKALDTFLLKKFGCRLNDLYRNQVGKVLRTLEAMKKNRRESDARENDKTNYNQSRRRINFKKR